MVYLSSVSRVLTGMHIYSPARMQLGGRCFVWKKGLYNVLAVSKEVAKLFASLLTGHTDVRRW